MLGTASYLGATWELPGGYLDETQGETSQLLSAKRGALSRPAQAVIKPVPSSATWELPGYPATPVIVLVVDVGWVGEVET